MYSSIKNVAKQVVRKLAPLTSPNFLFHNQFQYARKWAFTYPNGPVEGHYSQFGQDKFVATLLGHKHGGIFLDIGAHDGVSYSNSCFFERELGWYGICVEPHPDAFKRLENNRACTCVNAAVGISDRKAQFLQVVGQGEMLSGLVDSHADLQGAQQYAEHHGSEIHIIEIDCRTVHDILDANNVKALNYLSLDIEGGELEILKTIDLVALRWIYSALRITTQITG